MGTDAEKIIFFLIKVAREKFSNFSVFYGHLLDNFRLVSLGQKIIIEL